LSRRAVVAGLLALCLAGPSLAGATKGPVRVGGLVQGFQGVKTKLSFKPGQQAVVTVEGDGDSPLALVVLDARGRRVVADTRNTDRLTVRWAPRGREPYVIAVINRGGVPNRFVMRSN
jgi:hypothetical protein